MCEKCMSLSDSMASHPGMQSEFHTKKFNYDHAKAGAPISFVFGGAPTVLTFQRQGLKGQQNPILVETQTGDVLMFNTEGIATNKLFSGTDWSHDLVMRPLGYCEGRPVYVDDVLIGINDIPWKVTIDYAKTQDSTREYIARCKWPIYPKTRMSPQEIQASGFSTSGLSSNLIDLINLGIQRAIEDGDVTPTVYSHV